MEDITTLQTLEKLYRKYLQDPNLIDESWQSFFSGMEMAISPETDQGQLDQILDAYRRYGHLGAHINPLKEKPQKIEELTFKPLERSYSYQGVEMPISKIIEQLQRSYMGTIGLQYKHCDEAIQKFIEEAFEPLDISFSGEEKKSILWQLNQAEIFETFIHTRYVGQTRFSLEGVESFIPTLYKMIEEGTFLGAEEMVIGMAHRGRLNVLANILQKPYSIIFHEFESHILSDLEGSSDVKYHKGFSSDVEIGKNKVHLHIAANPSHLESINPVVLGQVWAKQQYKSEGAQNKIIPILIHGDASFAGQGVVYETQQMMHLNGYSVGGSLHIIVNNQIGFTTLPHEGRSTNYPTDLALAFKAPIFHVNAEDPDSAVFVARLAMKLRQKFNIDVFIDLSGYRKYGHNEGDEPSFTQPKTYQLIKEKRSIKDLYKEKLIEEKTVTRQEADKLEQECKKKLDSEMEKMGSFKDNHPAEEEIHGTVWQEFLQADEKELYQPINTTFALSGLQELGKKLLHIPENFQLHPKLKKLVQKKEQFLDRPQEKNIDWGFAEELAFTSILTEEIPIRIAGEDSQRGTFSHRHAIWVDQQTGESYFPLSQFPSSFWVYNSPLSEFGCLGFEHGVSLSYPKALVLWEAQYGDFVNGAQVVIDEYISSSEQKWRRRSALVILLPHGYEGQGPDHSSGRVERFLQLCAQDNMQVCYPTSSAQYFHLLRRQAKRNLKKPLIIFTPKSYLRHPGILSSLQELSEGSFEEYLDDPKEIKNPTKLIICSGKIFFDLYEKREEKKQFDTAIIRIEQFYPLFKDKLKKLLAKYKSVHDCVYVQEEPKNMGGYLFFTQFSDLLPSALRYVGQEELAAPAFGSYQMQKEKQEKILEEAFAHEK